MRNFTTDLKKLSGIWIFKLKTEGRKRRNKEEDSHIENVFDPKVISTENATVEPTITTIIEEPKFKKESKGKTNV
jgi:hypothetical protein